MDSFQKLFNEVEVNAAKTQSAIHEGLAKLRAGKKYAFRTAQAVKQLTSEHQSRLIDRLKDMGLSGKNIVDQWLEKIFAPCALMDDDYRDILAAVYNGMTEKQFMAESAAKFLSTATLKRAALKQPRVVPQEPSNELPIKEQLDSWRTRARALEMEVGELRKENTELRRRLTALEQQDRKLHKILKVK